MNQYQNILRGIFGVSLLLCTMVFILVKIIYLKKGRFPYFIFLIPLLSGVFVIALDRSRVFLVLYAVPVIISSYTIYINRQIRHKLMNHLQEAFEVTIVSKVRVMKQKFYAITTEGYLLIELADNSEKTELEDAAFQLHQELMLFSHSDQLIFRKLEKTRSDPK